MFLWKCKNSAKDFACRQLIIKSKLRIVVYGASAKIKKKKKKKSLNECLHKRPVISENRWGLLLRFHIKEILDIEKAFLYVRLQEVDQDVTRLLWFI